MLEKIWATSRARSLFGFSESERLTINMFMDVVHPADREARRNAIGDALASRHDYEVEFRVPLPDGQTRWILSRGRVERDAAGKPVLMRGLALDISARRRSELELQQLRGQLAHVARVSMLRQLAAALAHGLGQPPRALAVSELLAGCAALTHADAAARRVKLESRGATRSAECHG